MTALILAEPLGSQKEADTPYLALTWSQMKPSLSFSLTLIKPQGDSCLPALKPSSFFVDSSPYCSRPSKIISNCLAQCDFT